MSRKINGRSISRGIANGVALATAEPISFLGDVDAKTGVIVALGHELYGSSVAKKVFVFPTGKGSTVGSYVLYQLKENGVAPAAIINQSCEPIVAVGAIISDIPLIDSLEVDPIIAIKTGAKVCVNANEGYVEVER